MQYKNTTISELVGSRVSTVFIDTNNERVLLNVWIKGQGEAFFLMEHAQDCCEHVYLAEVVGDWEDLLQQEILEATEVTNSTRDNEHCEVPREGISYDRDSWTWTFYTLRSNKGTVTLRWLGSSNGYYAEGVSLYRMGEEKKETTLLHGGITH